MKINEIRLMSTEEISTKLEEAKKEFMLLRFQAVSGQLTDTSKIQISKKLIARFETILREKELGINTEGEVASNKMMKTIIVEISRTFRHPLYEKVVHTSKKLKVHDELNCQVGDEVQIVECKPISKHKSWIVEKIIKSQASTVVEPAIDEV